MVLLKKGDMMNKKYFKKMRILNALSNVIFYGMILFTLISLVVSVMAIYYPSDKFIAIKGNDNWLFKFKITENFFTSTLVPFNIIQGLDPSMFSAKDACITNLVYTNTFKATIIIFGIFQLRKLLILISNSKMCDNQDFMIAKVINNIGLLVVIFSLFGGLLQNICCWIFVTKIFCLDLTTINLNGIFIGLIIIALSEYIKFNNQMTESI